MLKYPFDDEVVAFVVAALRHGPIYTLSFETSLCNCEELDWVRTSAAHPDWVPGIALESVLLSGLAAAATRGAVLITPTVIAGDSAAYSVRWGGTTDLTRAALDGPWVPPLGTPAKR